MTRLPCVRAMTSGAATVADVRGSRVDVLAGRLTSPECDRGDALTDALDRDA